MYPGEIKTDLHAHEQDRLPDWYRPADAVPAEDMSAAIIAGVEGNQREVFLPAAVRLLRVANGISPKLSDRILRALRGGTSAPRVD